MKRIVLFGVLSLLLAMALAGCAVNGGSGDNPAVSGSPTVSGNDSPTGSEAPVGGGLKTAAVIFDRGCGSTEENYQRETVNSYEDITPEELARAMSEWSGLDFTVTFSDGPGGLTVDWAADSTLIAKLDDRVQKEDFFFFDADSMRWFMMDSMLRTLNENGFPTVYYTMDGGKELVFDALYPVREFPSDVPYMGSPFYYAHADVRGDEESAMDVLAAALGDQMDGKMLVESGEEEIGGVLCTLFALGADHTENFVAEQHFAVSPTGELYTMDILQGADWIPYP